MPGASLPPAVLAVADTLVRSGLVSKRQLKRATTVLKALVRAGEARRMTATAVKGRWLEMELQLEAGGFIYSLKLREAETNVPRKTKLSMTHEREHNGRLDVWVRGPGLPSQGVHFRDRARKSLFEMVPDVIGLVEDALPAAENRARRQAEAIRAREAAELAREQSRQQEHVESELAAAALQQLERFNRARDLDAYAEALRRSAESLEGDALAQALEWIDWIESHAAAIDPVRQPIRTPRIVPLWSRS